MYSPYYQNPYTTQNRLNQMEQQYPQFASYQQNTVAGIQSNILKGRPVASLDEAKASMIDLDGSISFFPDITNKKIYTKQINLDGTATFNSYTQDVQVAPTTPVVSKSESNNKDDINNLQSQIDSLKEELSVFKQKGANSYDAKHESIPNSRHDK